MCPDVKPLNGYRQRLLRTVDAGLALGLRQTAQTKQFTNVRRTPTDGAIIRNCPIEDLLPGQRKESRPARSENSPQTPTLRTAVKTRTIGAHYLGAALCCGAAFLGEPYIL